MITKTCQFCTNTFTVKYSSNGRKNCDEHKGFFLKNHKIKNNTLHRKCIKCKLFKLPNKFYKKAKSRGSSWCIECHDLGTYSYQSERALQRKIKCINKKGGKCQSCGYKKNLSALAFHHIDPSNKEFNLDSRTLANNSINTIYKELSKCILLCQNCHQEEHYPHLSGLF